MAELARPSPVPQFTPAQEEEWRSRALAGVMNTPADLATLYPALSGIPEIAGLGSLPGAQATAQFVDAWQRRVYDINNIDAPETPSEYAMEIANPLAISKMPVKALERLPTALRALEPLFPMVQGPWSPGRAAANAAVPFVVQQGISEAVTDQETIFDPSFYSNNASAAETVSDIDLSLPDPPMPEVAMPDVDTISASIDTLPDMAAPQLLNDPDTWVDLGAVNEEKEYWRKLAYGALAGAAVLTGAGHAARMLQARRARSLINTNSEFTGEAPRDLNPQTSQTVNTPALTTKHETVLGNTSTVLQTQLIDGQSPIFRRLKQVNDPVQAETVSAYVQTIGNPSAMAKRVDAFLKTGGLPGSSVRFDVPYAAHVAKVLSMSPQEIGGYHTLKQAYSALDDVITFRRTGGKEGRPLWGVYDEGGLQARIQQLEQQFPKARELYIEHQGMMRKMLDYAEEAGQTSSAEKAAWIYNRPHYSPLKGRYRPDGLRMFKRMLPERPPDPDEFIEVFNPRESKLDPGMLKDSILSDIEYMTDVMRYVESNRVRRMTVEALAPTTFPDGTPVVKIKNKKTDKPGIRFRDSAGIEKYAEINDPALLSALRFRPHMTGGILESAARLAMSMNTGKYNPLFAKASLTYEAAAAPLLLKSGRRLGATGELISRAGDIAKAAGADTIGSALNRLGGNLNLSSFDPTFIPALAADAAGVLIRSTSLRAANKIRVSRFNNGLLARMLGPQNADALVKIIQDSYERSAYHLYESYGGGNAVFIETNTFARPETVGKSIPELAQLNGAILSSSTLGRSYNMVLEAIHNAVRYRHVSANVQRKLAMITNEDGTQRLPRMSDFGATGRLGQLPVIQFEPIGGVDHLTRLAADTRNLTGDVTRRPGDVGTKAGIANQVFLSQAMYANHFVQVSAQIARMIKDHPARFSTTLATMGVGTLALVHQAMEEDPSILQEMSPQQRMTNIPIVFNGKTQWLLNVPPELRMYVGPLIESYLNTNGFLNEQLSGTQFGPAATLSPEEALARDSLREAFGKILLSDIIPNPVGPGINVGIAIGSGIATYFGGMEAPTTSSELFTGRRGTSYIPPRDEFRTVADKNNSVLEDTARIILEEQMGAAGDALITSGEHMLTALGHDQPASEIFAIGAESLSKRERNTVAPLLGIDKRVNLMDPVSDYVRQTKQAMKALDPILMRGVMGAGERMSSDRPMNEDPGGFMPNLRGTDMAIVLPHAKQVQWHLRRIEPMYTVLDNQKSQIERNPYISVAVRQTRLNELTLKQRELNKEAFNVIKTAEDAIAEALGREFSFATETVMP